MPLSRTQAEIDRVTNWAMEGEANGTRYPGMSYEEGVRAALDWVTGSSDDAPDDE